MNRAADDVEAIYENIQRLKREREQAINGEPAQPPCDTEQDTQQDYACGWRDVSGGTYTACDEVMLTTARFYIFTPIEPGEHTDGA